MTATFPVSKTYNSFALEGHITQGQNARMQLMLIFHDVELVALRKQNLSLANRKQCSLFQ